MIRRALASLVLCLILLFAGIYLGAHPSGLPGFLRDPLVGDQDTRVVNEAIDTVNDTYYRKIPKKDLANKAIAGIVSSLDDRFSNYFDPKSYAKFQLQQSGEFAGIGVQVVARRQTGCGSSRSTTAHRPSEAKLAAGDVIVAVNGRPLKGKTSDASIALIQGQHRDRRQADGRSATASAARSRCGARRSRSPRSPRRQRTIKGKKYAVVRLDQFSSGAHGEVNAALRKALKGGAKGVVFDLRSNPGGLVTEAQLVASAFLSDGKIVTTKGRAVPSKTLSAVGDPIAPKIPLVVLVDRNSASAAEIVAGALQDRKRATLVGTRTFGKGVFQEVLELSNGGALDITAGQYFLPSGRNLGGAGVSTGSGLTPDVRGQRRPQDAEGRRGARQGARRAGREDMSPRGGPRQGRRPPRESGSAGADGSGERFTVGVLAKRGRLVVAEPFFDTRGRQSIAVDPGRNGRPGQLVLVRSGGRAKGHAKIARVIGKPDVARDVIEALMHDRGLRRAFPPGVERAAKEAVERVEDQDPAAAARRDLRALATFTIDPASARDFDDAISAEARGEGRVAHLGAHRRRERVRPAGLADRPRGLPARDVGLRAGRGRADAARDAVQRRLLAGSGPGAAGRHGRAGPRRGGRRAQRLLPLTDPQRRAAGLRPRRPDLRGRGGGGGAVGVAAGRRARRVGRAARAPRRRGRAGRGVGRAGVRLRPRRPRGLVGGLGADRVPSADRAPDDRRQRGGRAAAERARRPGALPDPRAAGARRGRAAAGAARDAGRADASGAGEHRARRCGGHHRGRVAAGGRRGPPPRRQGPAGPDVAGAAVAQAGQVLAGEQGPRRAALDAPTRTSPRRSAAIPISSATARC